MNIYLEEAEKVLTTLDDTLYVLSSETEEVIFTIDGIYSESGEIVSYSASNAMGAGQWERDTLEEIIKAIEEAYNDTVIDRTDKKILGVG